VKSSKKPSFNPERIELKSSKKPSFNPERIESFSPGLARFREGLPWVMSLKSCNPEGVEYQGLTKRIQPLQGCDFFLFSPRVARGAQPWAECSNAVRIEKPKARFRTSPGIPPRTLKNPKVYANG
jgi:hypothetical protein